MGKAGCVLFCAVTMALALQSSTAYIYGRRARASLPIYHPLTGAQIKQMRENPPISQLILNGRVQRVKPTVSFDEVNLIDLDSIVGGGKGHEGVSYTGYGLLPINGDKVVYGGEHDLGGIIVY